ncbi:cytochrome P450 [Geodermatophilus sp. URMC 64]
MTSTELPKDEATPQLSMDEQMRMIYAIMTQPFAEAELAAAMASPQPQDMLRDLVVHQPVRKIGDFYAIQTRDDIRYVTKHPQVEQGFKYLGSDRPAIPLGLDGAEHKKYRRLLEPVFTAARVAPLADRVREQANSLIDDFINEGQVEAISRWCEPLPSTIFLSIMGLPMDDVSDFLRFKRVSLAAEPSMVGLSADEFATLRSEAVAWIQAYFTRELDEREKTTEQKEDIIGWLLAAEVDGHRLSREEMLDILGLFMVAGLDTVASSLACFLSYLARHPEDRTKLVQNPELITSAVEELLRFESPVLQGQRIARADLDLPSGTTIPAGSWMQINWHTANLDPKAFEEPLRVDFERKPNPHIAFAAGFHRCLGSHLARLELQTALQVWHERVPDYQLQAGKPLTYSGNPRAPHELWLTLS